MIPEHYPYNVGFEWVPPYRVARIRSVIESAKQDHHKLTVPDMESLQNDVTSLPALEFQKLVRSTRLKDDPALAGFLRWDGKLTRESSDAALYEVWFQQICLALGERFSNKDGDSRLQKPGGRYNDLPPDTVLRILTNPDKDLFGAGDNPLTARNQLLADTLQSARKELEKLLGPDASQWSWGNLHTVHFRHALDQQPGAKDLLDLGPLSRPGDEYTVNATAFWRFLGTGFGRELSRDSRHQRLGSIGRRQYARPERPARQPALLRPDGTVGRWPLFSATLFPKGCGS